MFKNKNEKEKTVIDLYVEGKTIREIAKIVHMSFSTISSIIKNFENGLKRKDNLKNSIISEETKAIQLFSEGKTPTRVKIELDMATEEVERLYKDYWKLRGLYQLYNFYETEIKEDLSSFLKLYERTREFGISDEVIIQALRNINEFPLINLATNKKRKEVRYLSDTINALKSKVADLKRSKASAEKLLESLLDEIKRQSSIVGRNQQIEKLKYDSRLTVRKYESQNDET